MSGYNIAEHILPGCHHPAIYMRTILYKKFRSASFTHLQALVFIGVRKLLPSDRFSSSFSCLRQLSGCVPGPSRLAMCIEAYISASSHYPQGFSFETISITELCCLFVLTSLLSFSFSSCLLYLNPPRPQSAQQSPDLGRTESKRI